MEFTKGYILEGRKFIAEKEMVKVTLESGEIVVGILLKPAKKEFRLAVKDMVRVLKISETASIELFLENE